MGLCAEFGVPCLVQGLLSGLPRVRVCEQRLLGDVPPNAVVVAIRRFSFWKLAEEGAQGKGAVGVWVLLDGHAQLEAGRAVRRRERGETLPKASGACE